jgi:hypothetical protein
MASKVKRVSLLLLVTIVFAATLSAQPVAAKGNIWGYVRDSDTFTPIPSALFEAIPRESGAVAAQAYTNDQGYFDLTVTAGKTYHFRASAEGYIPSETADIVVPTDHDLPFDNILLQKSPVAGFAIQPVVNNVAVVAGNKATYTLVLIAAPQSSANVTIDLRSTIAGTGYVILPASMVELKPRENSTINVVVSTVRSVQPGTYNFVVTASSAKVTQTAIMTLTIYAAPPTPEEQILTTTMWAAPIILACVLSVTAGFAIGRRRASRSSAQQAS